MQLLEPISGWNGMSYHVLKNSSENTDWPSFTVMVSDPLRAFRHGLGVAGRMCCTSWDWIYLAPDARYVAANVGTGIGNIAGSTTERRLGPDLPTTAPTIWSSRLFFSNLPRVLLAFLSNVMFYESLKAKHSAMEHLHGVVRP